MYAWFKVVFSFCPLITFDLISSEAHAYTRPWKMLFRNHCLWRSNWRQVWLLRLFMHSHIWVCVLIGWCSVSYLLLHVSASRSQPLQSCLLFIGEEIHFKKSSIVSLKDSGSHAIFGKGRFLIKLVLHGLIWYLQQLKCSTHQAGFDDGLDCHLKSV